MERPLTEGIISLCFNKIYLKRFFNLIIASLSYLYLLLDGNVLLKNLDIMGMEDVIIFGVRSWENMVFITCIGNLFPGIFLIFTI